MTLDGSSRGSLESLHEQAPLVGLDIGDKRVGVALGWRSPAFARPAGTFLRAQGKAEDQILELLATRGVGEIIVGLPLNDDGSENEQCDRVRNFCRRLERRTSVKIRFVDEYCTSQDSIEKLALGGIASRAARREGRIDAASAALILQSYLDRAISDDAVSDQASDE